MRQASRRTLWPLLIICPVQLFLTTERQTILAQTTSLSTPLISAPQCGATREGTWAHCARSSTQRLCKQQINMPPIRELISTQIDLILFIQQTLSLPCACIFMRGETYLKAPGVLSYTNINYFTA